MFQLAKTGYRQIMQPIWPRKEGKKEKRNQKQAMVAKSVASNGSGDSCRLQNDQNLEDNSLNRVFYF